MNVLMTLEQTVKKYILNNRLMDDDGVYVVALSGGPDSVALLRVLARLGYKTHAAHCNFHLRGAESDRDEAFCVSLCKQLGIPLHIVHFDTVAYAELHKVSIEMAARHLRYHWFTQLCGDIGAAGICVAHHQDDQVETVLLNMLRGTGLRGLTGMRPQTVISNAAGTCRVIRPLLCVSEAQVMDYLSRLSQAYVVDSSNLNDDVRRNKLRLDIIPLLGNVTPAARQNIIRMTENLRDIEAIAAESLNTAKERASVDASPLLPLVCPCPGIVTAAYDLSKIHDYVAPATLLWDILSPYGFNRPQIEEIANGKNDNREWRSNDNIALVNRGLLTIADLKLWDKPLAKLVIPEPGLYRYANNHIRVSTVNLGESFSVSKNPCKVSLDASKVKFPVVIRQTVLGDRFTPFGMKGSKLVSDYLKDRKRNVVNRHLQLVLTDADNNIVWLVGECIDDKCKIIHDTAQVVEVELY